jgi:hypothetical protein
MDYIDATGASYSASNRLDASFIGNGNVSNDEFENLSGVTSNVQLQLTANETEASLARSVAEVAQAMSNDSLTIANEAQSNATDALSTANSAQSTANTAQSTANSALSTANSAQSTANSAQSTANSALTTANSKVGVADPFGLGYTANSCIVRNEANTEWTQAIKYGPDELGTGSGLQVVGTTDVNLSSGSLINNQEIIALNGKNSINNFNRVIMTDGQGGLEWVRPGQKVVGNGASIGLPASNETQYNNVLYLNGSQNYTTLYHNDATYIQPLRSIQDTTGFSDVKYNSQTKELTFANSSGGGGLTPDANGTYTIGDVGVAGNLVITPYVDLNLSWYHNINSTNHLQVISIKAPLHNPSATVQSDWDTFGTMYFWPNNESVTCRASLNVHGRMWYSNLESGTGTNGLYSNTYAESVRFKPYESNSNPQIIRFQDGSFNEQARIVSHTGAATFVSVTQTSDDRYKSRTTPISKASEYLMKLKPCIYEKHPGLRVEEGVEDSDLSGVYHYTEAGLIAQDLEKIPGLEWTVKNVEREIISDEEKEFYKKEKHDDEDKDKKTTDFPKTYENCKSVDYTNFIAYLIKGFQEQQDLINNLTTRIELLEAK